MNTLNTQAMIESLNDVDFLSRQQASELASVALREFSRRSNEAKAVIKAVYNMALAGGCPNAVYNAVEKLAARYAV